MENFSTLFFSLFLKTFDNWSDNIYELGKTFETVLLGSREGKNMQ